MTLCRSLLSCVLLLSLAWVAGCHKKNPTAGKSDDPARASQASHPAPPPHAMEYVKLTTSMGDIYLELNRTKAPISVENFLGYVDRGDYDNTIFHRVISAFVVQGGGFTPQFRELTGGPPIANEWQNGLKNVRGSVGMARDTEPDTATREFYINCQDNPKLDTARDTTGYAGYAVFGRVYAGMLVVDRMRLLKTTSHPDFKHPNEPDKDMQNVPVDPPVLLDATRISPEEAKRAADADSDAKRHK